MTTYSYAQLVAPQTYDQRRLAIRTALASRGLPSTAWQSGAVPRAMYEIQAEESADMQLLHALIANGGLLSAAGISGDAWLDLVAENVFQETRDPALFTEGAAVLTCSAGAGPYSITPGVYSVGTSSNLIYQINTTGTLLSGGTLPVTIKAERTGGAYNVSAGTINQMVTTLAGVTVNNPSSSWITTQGREIESNASLVTKCEEKWATLAMGFPSDFYSYWAKHSLDPQVITDVRIVDNNPGGPGTIWGYLATEDGAATSPQIAGVQAVLDARIPKCIVFTAKTAVIVEVDITATITIPASRRAAAELQLAIDMPAYFAAFGIADSGGARVSKEAIEAVMIGVGASDITPSLPAADIVLAQGEKPKLGTPDYTWIET